MHDQNTIIEAQEERALDELEIFDFVSFGESMHRREMCQGIGDPSRVVSCSPSPFQPPERGIKKAAENP